MNIIDSYMLGYWNTVKDCPEECETKFVLQSLNKLNYSSEDKLKYSKNKDKSYMKDSSSNSFVAKDILIKAQSPVKFFKPIAHSENKKINVRSVIDSSPNSFEVQDILNIANSCGGKSKKSIMPRIKLGLSEGYNLRNKAAVEVSPFEKLIISQKCKEPDPDAIKCQINSESQNHEVEVGLSNSKPNDRNYSCSIVVKRLSDSFLDLQNPSSRTAELFDETGKLNSINKKSLTRESTNIVELSGSSQLNTTNNKRLATKTLISKSSKKINSLHTQESNGNFKDKTLTSMPRRSERLATSQGCSLLNFTNPKCTSESRTVRPPKEKRKITGTVKKAKKIHNKMKNGSEDVSSKSENQIVESRSSKKTKKPTLKYLKDRDCKLQENMRNRIDQENDLFSSSFGKKLKNCDMYNFLHDDEEDCSDYLTIKTPKGKSDGSSTMTPRTNLLDEWGKNNVTPSLIVTPHHRNQDDKQSALAVVYHYLKDKPKTRKFPKGIYCSTPKKPVEANEKQIKNPSHISILRENQTPNNDSNLDEYFEESDASE